MQSLSVKMMIVIVGAVTLGLPSKVVGQTWWEKNRGGWDSEVSTPQSPEKNKEEVVKEKTKAKPRQVASLEDVSSVKSVAKTRRKRREPELNSDVARVSFLGGYSKTDVANTGAGAGTGSVINFGFNGDFQLGYFGLDIEGYYGTGSGSIPANPNDPTNPTTSDQSVQVKRMAVLANPKAQLPMSFLGMRIIPKVGAGYGLLSQQQSQAAGGITGEMKTNLSGLYGVVGLDFLPVYWLLIQADYAKSLSASGTINLSATGASDINVDAPGSAFQRIRVGGYLRLAGGFDVGAQYIQRSATWNVSGSATTQTESQFMGVVGYEF